MTDPEISTRLHPSDLAEVVVDETDDLERPAPFEADAADVVDQRLELPEDEEPEY